MYLDDNWYINSKEMVREYPRLAKLKKMQILKKLYGGIYMKRLIKKADIDRQRCEEVKEKLKQEDELRYAAVGLEQFVKYIIHFVDILKEYEYLDGGEKIYIQELIFLHRELLIDLFGEEMFQHFMQLVSLSNIKNEERIEELMKIVAKLMQVIDIFRSTIYH